MKKMKFIPKLKKRIISPNLTISAATKNKNNKINTKENSKLKIINLRKPINKIMSLDNFKKISKDVKTQKMNTVYSLEKSYLSPTVSFFHNNTSYQNINKESPTPTNKNPSKIIIANKYKSQKQLSPKKSPYKKTKKDLLNKNVKNNLYNKTYNDTNFQKFKNSAKTGNKFFAITIRNKKNKIDNKIRNNIKSNMNYKNRIMINKEKLKKLDNNLIFNSLIDIDNSETFGNNSKIKEFISDSNNDDIIKCNINNIEEINNKDDFNYILSSNESPKKGDNLNNMINNAFDVGSLSNISKNASGSIKGKINEEEYKNNNKGFEKIIKDFVEEEKCKKLFQEKIENKIIKESIQNNKKIEKNGKIEFEENAEIKDIINEKINDNNKNKVHIKGKKENNENKLEINLKLGKKTNNERQKDSKDIQYSKIIKIDNNQENDNKEKNAFNKRENIEINENILNFYIKHIQNSSENEKDESLVYNDLDDVSDSEIKSNISILIDDIINDAQKEDIASSFQDNLIRDTQNEEENEKKDVIKVEENEMKNIISDFIDDVINDAKNELENEFIDIASNFIDNIIIDAQNDVEKEVKDSSYYDNKKNDDKNESNDSSSFSDSKKSYDESKSKDSSSSSNGSEISDDRSKVKNNSSNFINNSLNSSENEEEDEAKNIIPNFIDNIISNAENDVEDEEKNIVENFIDNIIIDAQSETENGEKDIEENSIESIISDTQNDDENEEKDIVENFIDSIIIDAKNDAENKEEDIADNFLNNQIYDSQRDKENKDIVENFIANLIFNAENEAQNELKNIMSVFVDDVIKEAKKLINDKINFIYNIGNKEIKKENINVPEKKDQIEQRIINNNYEKKSDENKEINFENENFLVKKYDSINLENNDIYENKDNIENYENKNKIENYENGLNDLPIESKNENINFSKNLLNLNDKIYTHNRFRQSVQTPNISRNLDNFFSPDKNLYQSQEFPNTHIILTKYTLTPRLNRQYDFNNQKRSSLRREYQRINKFKDSVTENLQIIYDNYPDNENKNFSTNMINYENIYIKAKINKNKNKKILPLNRESNIDRMSKIKTKIGNIILKEPIKKYKLKYNITKLFFKRWKNIAKKVKKSKKDGKIIINTIIYIASSNKDNEMIYKVSTDLKSDQKDYIGYYDSNIRICYPISIKIHKGIYFLSSRNRISSYTNNFNNDKDEGNMEIYIVKKNQNRRFSFQKIDNYTFDGKL